MENGRRGRNKQMYQVIEKKEKYPKTLGIAKARRKKWEDTSITRGKQ